jgi:hypothetical protein
MAVGLHNRVKSLTGAVSSGFKQMLLLKILAKQGIIPEDEAKPTSRNWTCRWWYSGDIIPNL